MTEEKYKHITQTEIDELTEVILMGIPNEDATTIEKLKSSINVYHDLGVSGLRKNLLKFLTSISKTCLDHGINMTIHPDDPPYPILGLPRIVRNLDDYKFILTAVDSPFNGICFCTGSLGASQTNNLVEILDYVKSRVNFVHLRNVKKDEIGSFFEADHLDGDVNMYAIMKILVEENQNRNTAIPFRPDHGHQMLDDLNKIVNPGYSAIGRLRGLAEL